MNYSVFFSNSFADLATAPTSLWTVLFNGNNTMTENPPPRTGNNSSISDGKNYFWFWFLAIAAAVFGTILHSQWKSTNTVKVAPKIIAVKNEGEPMREYDRLKKKVDKGEILTYSEIDFLIEQCETFYFESACNLLLRSKAKVDKKLELGKEVHEVEFYLIKKLPYTAERLKDEKEIKKTQKFIRDMDRHISQSINIHEKDVQKLNELCASGNKAACHLVDRLNGEYELEYHDEKIVDFLKRVEQINPPNIKVSLDSQDILRLKKLAWLKNKEALKMIEAWEKVWKEKF